MADRAFLTPEEAAALTAESAQRKADENAPTERNGGLPVGGAVGAYDRFWSDQDARIAHDRRTSIIIDPPDGRLPPLKPGVPHQFGSTQQDMPGIVGPAIADLRFVLPRAAVCCSLLHPKGKTRATPSNQIHPVAEVSHGRSSSTSLPPVNRTACSARLWASSVLCVT